LLGLTLAPPLAFADIHLVAVSRTIDPATPFRLSLIITGEADARTYAVPQILRVTLTPDLGASARVDMRRGTPVPDQIDLLRGEFRRIDYVGEVPANLRGRVRIDTIDLDTAGMVVQLSTPRATAAADPAATAAAASASADAPGPAPVTALVVRSDDDPNRQDMGRLTFHEPMFAAVGGGIESNAKFQVSFKLRLYEPADKLSRGFLDNLFLGYTQTAFWDLTSDSKPFVDTNYAPSLFYHLPNTDWRIGGNAVGISAGYEHESNGRDEAESRSIDILFVRPDFTFGDRRDFHWTFSPKLYVYLEKSENDDIGQYRGYGDYRLTYGKNDDWQLAAILRKGTKSEAFSADLQATYPLNRLLPGKTGYLLGQYFSGYGEKLLRYNERAGWSLRLGYSVWR
jgi:outer membrane phospholipase A